MLAVNTYAEIEQNEIELAEKHLIVLLFVRPSLSQAKEIIDEFNYIHENSGRYCSVYVVGYTNDASKAEQGYRKVTGIQNADWYYSDASFVEFKNNLENRLNWKYSGEIEMLLLQSNPGGKKILNFSHYVAVDVLHGIRKEYIESFPRFMEALIRSSRSEVSATSVIRSVKHQQIPIKDILCDAIGDSKRIPTTVKKILKDQLFYRSANFYGASD